MTAHIEKAIILIKNQTTNKNWINNLFRDVTNKSFNREYIYIYINPLFTHFKINVVINRCYYRLEFNNAPTLSLREIFSNPVFASSRSYCER